MFCIAVNALCLDAYVTNAQPIKRRQKLIYAQINNSHNNKYTWTLLNKHIATSMIITKINTQILKSTNVESQI